MDSPSVELLLPAHGVQQPYYSHIYVAVHDITTCYSFAKPMGFLKSFFNAPFYTLLCTKKQISAPLEGYTSDSRQLGTINISAECFSVQLADTIDQ